MAQTKYNPDVNKNLKDKKYQDYLKSKGFNIKRDKGGKGFSMVIQKKIKGFEETEMAGERIDELSKSTLKSAQKGFAKRIATSAKAGDDKKVEKDVSNIAKAGHRIAGRYYPKYVRKENPTFGGHRKYKTSSGYTGKEPEARYTRKEEIEMNEDVERDEAREKVQRHADYAKRSGKTAAATRRRREISKKHPEDEGQSAPGRYAGPQKEEYEIDEEEGEEQEVQEPQVSDLVLNAIEQRPLDFQQSFADLMQQRIEDAVAERKLEVAAAFTGDDRSQYEAGEDDLEGEEEEEETEAEEEPESEEGTEEEE